MTKTVWKNLLHVRVDKNSFFCRSWKSLSFLQGREDVIIEGKEHPQISIILSKTRFIFFFEKTKNVTNTYCFATVAYIHRFRCVWIFFGLVPNQIRNNILACEQNKMWVFKISMTECSRDLNNSVSLTHSQEVSDWVTSFQTTWPISLI